MVCSKCEKKLTTVVVPDKWKDGARNTVKKTIAKSSKTSISSRIAAVSSSSKGAVKTGQFINQNMLLKKSERSVKSGSAIASKCRICRCQLHQQGFHYCQGCAYQKGICGMCGKKILDTKGYRQTNR